LEAGDGWQRQRSGPHHVLNNGEVGVHVLSLTQSQYSDLRLYLAMMRIEVVNARNAGNSPGLGMICCCSQA